MSERVLVLQLDGTALPNLACLRIAGFHRERGDEVTFCYCVGGEAAQRSLFASGEFDRVYGSLIFKKTRPLAESLRDAFPSIVLGGTGWDVPRTLEDAGIPTRGPLDWTIYPGESRSVGFSQRGCRLRCGFCVVPQKEGDVRAEQTVSQLWRGEPWPRDVVLLDNDFLGQPAWRERVAELREGRFRVSLCQGVNVRLGGASSDGRRDLRRPFGDEEAEALTSLDLWDDAFEHERLYCAWDARPDEERLFSGLDALARAGVPRSEITVYVLVGYWTRGALCPDDFYRVRRLREWGARPWPMPFARTSEILGFCRWVRFGHDERVTWEAWLAARCQPRNLGLRDVDRAQGRLFA